ncbi:MAG: CinA family nicotinamide mononucleotide deamidase-related protein [Anaerolineales bacterium]|nr:CinA family nicotinamide mononucleotide deamidase-related protein [Anaerolineales bacterium]
MPRSEIITIGTELLLGEIVDTNSAYIARTLRDAGVDVYRTSTVGDNIKRIAKAIKHGLKRAEIIITTGGLGPTVDDPTRDAVAKAMDVETEYLPELWEQIEARFRRFGRTPTENNRRQAYIPCSALPVENPVGTAPAFIYERGKSCVISLPGVPREMEHLLETVVMPYLRERYELKGLIKARILHTAGVGESQIDEIIGDLETLDNPTVGLAAHAGQVDVRITAKAESETAADEMIAELEAELYKRLGDSIYGTDAETLEAAGLDNLAEKDWTLVVLEAGLSGQLTQKLADAGGNFLGGEVLTCCPENVNLLAEANRLRQDKRADVCLSAALQPAGEKQNLFVTIISPVKQSELRFSYGGPPQMAPQWAVNLCLDLLRRLKPAS